jgi:hypothetical protein
MMGARGARSLFWVAPLALLGTACGGSANQAADAAPSGDLFNACADPTGADSYSAGMSKPSKNGTFTVELMSSDPGPPIKGTNNWTVVITNAAGVAVDGAAITVTPFMPAHNHGTTVKAVVTPLANGSYGIAPLYFFMAGVWQTTLDIKPTGDGATADSVVFSFCVDG